jgi:hypothetical protein
MRFPRNTGPFLALLVIACLVASAAPAVAKMKVGEQRPIYIDSARDYKGSPDGELFLAWEEVIHEPGATYVAVHFADFHLASGDYLRISDASGGQAYILEGRGKMNAGEFWARHIKGDTAVLQLFATSPGGAQGFAIDLVATGNRDFGYDPEAICGVDDKENAVCYASSHPEAYAASRPVARLLIGGMYLCTGWLASANGHFVTNQHCIETSTDALNTDFDFGAEALNCSDSNCQLCYSNDVYSGATFIRANAGLDYTLVQFTGANPASTYGYMQIDDRDAVMNEQIYIPQHPAGYAKELGIESTSDGDGLCHVNSVTAPACTGQTWYNDVGYYCDTEGGSSGSPVLAMSNHKVIALHHCGTCLNRGVPIDLVYAEIASYLGPECQEDGDCDDGLWCNGAEACVGESCEDGNAPCTVDEICDEVNHLCIPRACDVDGVCESGEDCEGCPEDCISGDGATCGNHVCETAAGEDCRSCPTDCNSVLGGRPSSRFCCGDDVNCDDSRCTDDQNTCNSEASSSYCCGDGTCEGAEDSENCAVDCGAAPFCGDLSCNGDETQCTCSVDCGTPPGSEVPNSTCADDEDNDCDTLADCDDSDCIDDPACTIPDCLAKWEPCTVDSECCSNWCHRGTCK